LRRDGGEAMRALIGEIGDILKDVSELDSQDDIELGCAVRNLANGIEALKTATDLVLKSEDKDALAASCAYLELCGNVISGAYLIKGVVNGLKKQDPRANTMQKLVWFHSVSFLARAAANLEQIKYGAAPVFAFDKQLLADL
jgi:hypothetical protein